ncbi:zinc finger protein 646 [Phlebotomus argentipes]|uniref:zinc finger protein 646 n=1 Tax=Phlebotomus argentipes TaxID=94469 RepID=UPI002892A433|nr:zinc finger protein 646 [Phlebotomus argentipes]
MFWILRRTGAANFFNSINNNYSSKANTISSHNSDKNNPRPPRKAYGRLSVESDDNSSMRRDMPAATETSLIDFDNCPCDGTKGPPGMRDTDGNIEESDSELELEQTMRNQILRNRRYDDSTIARLQAMAMSDDEDYDESLTCNVCDRAFHCHRQLANHQQKKRHFGCSGCDSLFPSLMLLEHHKEEFEHWSDMEDENRRYPCCRRNRGEEYSDTETGTSDAESEDLERLL